MKLKITKHLLIIGLLLGVFLLSLTQMANARKLPPPPPLKFILVTYCCSEGQTTGASKDCIEGEGFCFDSQCQGGEMETPFPNCP
jgi:hypothetical protein